MLILSSPFLWGVFQVLIPGSQTHPQAARTAGCLGGAYIGGKCLIFSKDELPWNDAKESCSRQNGRLAILNDPQAFKSYVHREYPGDEKFWLGLSDIENEGTWIWVNGQPLEDNFPWHSGEPNAAFPDEDCLVLWGDALSDAPCPRHYRYVCEKDTCSEAEGFFRVPESGNQCIKILGIHSRNWKASNKACQDVGLRLAKPIDPVAMRKYIIEKLGDGRYYWLGARVTDSGVMWNDGTRLNSNNPAWYPGLPGRFETNTDYCLKLLTYQIDLDQQPENPYYIQPCEWKANLFAMCE